MRIKSLQKQEDDRPRLPISFKLKLGEPMSRSGDSKHNRPGKTLEDSFRFSISSRDDRPLSPRQEALSRCFQKHYGSKIVNLVNVYLIFDTSELAYPTSYENWQSGSFKFRCDGQRIHEEVEAVDRGDRGFFNELQACDRPCGGEGNPQACPLGCRPTGRLYLAVQELWNEGFQSFFGVLETTGIYNAIALTEQLDFYDRQFGGVARSPFRCPPTLDKIPWILTREPRTFNQPEQKKQGTNYVRTGKTRSGTVWIPKLDPSPKWMQWYREWMQWMQSKERLGMPQQSALHLPEGASWKTQSTIDGTDRPALPPGVDLSVDRPALYAKIATYMSAIGWDKTKMLKLCRSRYQKNGGAVALSDSELMDLILYMEENAENPATA